jgi:hypothetical protein
MSKALNTDGFRGWLEKAVRADDDVDWSSHTVDYPRFKQRLKFFARRRSQIRNMVRTSADGKLSEQVLIDLLGPKTSFPAKKIGGDDAAIYSNAPLSHNLSMDPHSHIGMGPPEVVNVPTTDYVEMNDENENVARSASTDIEEASQSSADGLNPHKRRRTQRAIMRRLSVSERNEIIVFLEWEMDKVLMFYLSQWQRLSHRLEQQQAQQQIQQGSAQQWLDDSGNTVRAYAGGQQDLLDTELGDEILELIAFCVINVVTAQQILLRYDAFARACEGTPMLNYYMKRVTKHPTSFRKILFHEELQAIANGFAKGSEGLPFVIHFKAQRTMFRDILESLQSTESLSTRDRGMSPIDALMNGFRNWFLVGLFEDRLGLEPAYLTARGQSLTSEMERLSQWRSRKYDIVVSKSKEKKLSGLQVFHLTLNMLAAFLYCMNYYVSSCVLFKQCTKSISAHVTD